MKSKRDEFVEKLIDSVEVFQSNANPLGVEYTTRLCYNKKHVFSYELIQDVEGCGLDVEGHVKEELLKNMYEELQQYIGSEIDEAISDVVECLNDDYWFTNSRIRKLAAIRERYKNK